jgi:hypothetical protein
MKHIKAVLTNVRKAITDSQSSLLRLQSSFQDSDNVWHNDTASINQIVNCTDDSKFFNVWVRLEEGATEELNTFIEEQLVPNNLRILEDTEKPSKDGKSVRFMIARPLTS